MVLKPKASHCNVCNGVLQTHLPMVVDPITGGQFGVDVCTACGLGHTNPHPRDLGVYYPEAYYGNRHGFSLAFCLRRRLRLVNATSQSGPGSLLDIGCGDGSFLEAAENIGWRVMGTERNPAAARARRIETKEEISHIVGRSLFDCITMWHTLEHMQDISAMLNQVDRLLKPAGKVIIAVPDFGGFQSKLYRENWLHLDVPRHLYHFTEHSLRVALQAQGLTVVKRYHQEFEYDALGWSQSALNRTLPHPNIFLGTLAGKKNPYGCSEALLNFLLGVSLSVAMMPLVPVGALLRRGGTLIMIAEKGRG